MADPIDVKAPDGSIVRFPAGTSDDVINGAMTKEFGSSKAAAPAAPSSGAMDIAKSVAHTLSGPVGLAVDLANSDVGKSAATGVVKGGIGMLGAAGDISGLLARASKTVGDYVGGKLGYEPSKELSTIRLPGAADIQKGVEGVIGDFYQPKTTAGEYAQTAGEFLPAVAGGPEGLVPKLISRVAIPAAVSETGGQLTKGTAAEPYVRAAGAVLAPFAGGGVERAANLVNGGVEGMTVSGGNRLVRAVQADGGPAAVRQRLADLGPDAMLVDGGPALLGKGQGVSLNSDEGRSILQTGLTDRNTGTNARIQSDVNAALGPAEDPQTVTNAIRAHRSAVDAVNYPAALDNAAPVQIAPIMRDLVDRIDQTPVGSMEHRALTNLQTMMTRHVNQPRIDPLTGRQAIDAQGNMIFDQVPVSHDQADILHRVKGELDNVIEYDAPGLGVPAGALTRQQGSLRQMRGAINDALEEQVPGYANANAVSAALARRGEAVQSGTQLLRGGMTAPSPQRFAAEFEPLPHGEKIAMAKGNRGDIDRILGQNPNDLVAIKRALQGTVEPGEPGAGWNTANIATLHGRPTADALVGTVDRNTKFRDTYNKIVENSQTAQRQAAAKLENPNTITENDIITPSSTMFGTGATIAKRLVAKGVNSALENSRLLSQSEMARALTEQGTARDSRLAAIEDAIRQRQRNASATGGGNRAADAVTAALLAHQGHPEPSVNRYPHVVKALLGQKS